MIKRTDQNVPDQSSRAAVGREAKDYTADDDHSTNENMDCAARLRTIRAALRDIRIKIDNYKRHNAQIMKDLTRMIDVLDTRYRELQRRIDWIQISIIAFSSTSSFLLASKHVVVVPDKFIDFFALCVTTWTSMSLTIGKYFKFEEKKEQVSQLRSALSSLVVDVQSRDDAISTFEAQSSWKSTAPPKRAASTNNSSSAATNVLFPMVMPWMAPADQGLMEEVDDDAPGRDATTPRDEHFEVCSDEWEKLDMRLKDQLTVISDKKLQLTREFERSLFHHDYKNKIEIKTELARIKHRERMKSIVDLEKAEKKEDISADSPPPPSGRRPTPFVPRSEHKFDCERSPESPEGPGN